MVFDLCLPQQLTGPGIQRLDIRSLIAEVGSGADWRSCWQRAHADRRSHFRTGIRGPISTPGPSIQAIDQACFSGYIEAIADNRRLSGGHWCGMGKCPFDLEFRDILRLDTRRRLEPRVSRVSAPAIPLLPLGINRSGSGFATVGIRVDTRAGARLFTRQMNCKGANLIGAKTGCLLPHNAGSERLNYVLGRTAADQK